MLPVAYHNLAVEYEHLGQHEEAMESYLQARRKFRFPLAMLQSAWNCLSMHNASARFLRLHWPYGRLRMLPGNDLA